MICQTCRERPATTFHPDNKPEIAFCAICRASEIAYIRAHYTAEEIVNVFGWITRDENTIEERFARREFSLQNMGGNCAAYVRVRQHNGQTVEEIVTLADDTIAPDELDDLCRVGDHPFDGDDDEHASMAEVFTARTILSTLDRNEDDLLSNLLADVPEDSDDCAACAREHGPHYRGECEHGK